MRAPASSYFISTSSATSASRRRAAIESINEGGARITTGLPANLTSGGTEFPTTVPHSRRESPRRAAPFFERDDGSTSVYEKPVWHIWWFGKTPIANFLDAMPMRREKSSANEPFINPTAHAVCQTKSQLQNSPGQP